MPNFGIAQMMMKPEGQTELKLIEYIYIYMVIITIKGATRSYLRP